MYIEPDMPDGMKTYGKVPDVGILSSEGYAGGVRFSSHPLILEAAL